MKKDPNNQIQPQYGMSDLYIALIVAFLVILITYFLSRKLRKQDRIVVLTGLSDSGKTALFSRLIFNKPKKSVTSLKENEASLGDLNLKLIDLPGADRLREKYWEQYRSKARHVIFLVDSVTVEDKTRDLCEYLYDLLSDKQLHQNKIQFTIACNKQDLEDAQNKEFIRKIIERELNAIRDTRSGRLAKTSDEEQEDYLAKLKPGTISLETLKVNMIETSVNNPDQLIKLLF